MSTFEQLVLGLLLWDTLLITVGFIFCKQMVSSTPEEIADQSKKALDILRKQGYRQ